MNFRKIIYYNQNILKKQDIQFWKDKLQSEFPEMGYLI